MGTNDLSTDYFSIPLMLIKQYSKGGDKKSFNPWNLDLLTKCGRRFKLIFSLEDAYNFTQFWEILEQLVPPTSLNAHFAFAFHANYPDLERKYKGWQVYDIDREFDRQGLRFYSQEDIIEKTESDIHYKKIKNYIPGENTKICDTYPPEVIIPSLLKKEELIKGSKFRSKNRFPALVYYYKLDDTHAVTLWRSSQCKSGLYQNRSPEDELYIRLIGNVKSRDMPNDSTINVHIYDARPYLNAVAQKVNGKGYENINYYKNAEIFFLQIDNIHVVRDNYKKVVEACEW